MFRGRRTRRWALVLAVCLFSGLFVGMALAHTHVAETAPADGDVVDGPPSQVYIRFGEEGLPASPGQISDGHLVVLDACGKQVDNKDSAVNMQESSVTVTSGGTPSGRYEVQWYATAADGAEQSGLFNYTVENGSPCTTAERTDPKKDVELGLDPVSLRSRSVKGGALLRVTMAKAFKCADLAPKGTDRLTARIDTGSDRTADLNGEFVCRRGKLKLELSARDGDTGKLAVKKPTPRSLEVKLPRGALVAHADVFVESVFDSEDDCAEKVCVDIAPDLGWLRAF